VTDSEKPSYFVFLSQWLFGKIAPRLVFKPFKEVYKKSGIVRLYDSYVASMLFTSMIVFSVTFAMSLIIHNLMLDVEIIQSLLAVTSLSCVITMIVPISFVAYPLYRGNQRRKEIDSNLVYTTGYMGVLSSGGISIERIFERVVQVEQRATIKDLAKRFIANIKVFGLDVTASLRDLAQVSPSEDFSRLLTGFVNTVKTSGDLKSLLAYETKELLQAKRGQLKKTLNTLMTLGEIYITAIVMGPILFLVMLTILSIMGTGPTDLSAVEQLNLLVFLGLPMISTLFILVLNGVLPEED
jgi:archaellum biogenesis protein FlaJ (TadC family)